MLQEQYHTAGIFENFHVPSENLSSHTHHTLWNKDAMISDFAQMRKQEILKL